MLGERKIGSALVGCWVWTQHNLGWADAAIRDECTRNGYAYGAYRGSDRIVEWAPDLDEETRDLIETVDEDDLLDRAWDAVPGDALEETYRSVLIEELPEWRGETVMLAECDNPEHETAEELYNSLGYHVSTENFDDISHPVVSFSALDDDDDVILMRLMEDDGWEDDKEDNELAAELRDAYEDLLDYARNARDYAESVVSCLDEAIASHKKRDLYATLEALEGARSIEDQYGDDPATENMASQLLACAEDASISGLIEALA
jgi:hypothetical protein